MDQFKTFLQDNKKWLLGALAGLIIGILFLTLGFFATILLALLTVFGALLVGSENFRIRVWGTIKGLFNKIFRK